MYVVDEIFSLWVYLPLHSALHYCKKQVFLLLTYVALQGLAIQATWLLNPFMCNVLRFIHV